MRVKTRKGLAFLLAFALTVTAMFTGNVMRVKAAQTDISFTIQITIAEGTTAPGNYGVEYQVVDADGSNLDGDGYAGFVGNSSEQKIVAINVDEACKIKIKVNNAGLGIRLDGADVTAEGWADGKEVAVSDINNKEYRFELFAAPQGGGSEEGGNEGGSEEGGNEGGSEEGGNEGGSDSGNEFSGTVYFIWQGADDAVCFHKITGLNGAYINEQGQWMYDTNFIPVSSVVAEESNEPFVIQSDRKDTYYYWVWENAIDTIQKYTSFEALRADIEKNEDLRRSIAIDPCGATDGNGTVNTYGDRQFRASIYENTSFEGISFGRNSGDYTYFPGWWDPMFFTNELDITGSSKNDPAVYEAFTLEPKIQFQTTANSVNTITGIRPLDVPTGAVTIAQDGAGNFDITFGSNFFDDVVFELTTAGETYYVKIVRTAIQVHDNFGPGQTDPKITCELYYDEQETAGNYDLMATVYYKDGSTEIKKLAPSTTDNNGGVGMKYAEYELSYNDGMTGIAYTAVKAGALSGDSFGGIFIGSESGTYYDIEARRIIY